MVTKSPEINNFRPVPRSGVIYVMTEAEKLGYHKQSKDWANLGQGSPEVGPLEGAPDRIKSIPVQIEDLNYAPTDGIIELKEAIADFYNKRYREGKKSQYTKDNVAVCSGGRLALTRIVSALGYGNVGHFLPDYTAYEELLDAFRSFTAIPILRKHEENYKFSPENFKEEVLGLGLSAVLLSNPANPIGTVIKDEALDSWVKTARELECTVVFDEFYSHYVYDSSEPYLSAAKYIEDVNKDPAILFDGLTKNWRYPGLRVSWTLAPKAVIEALASAGSFLDGGCARPIQRVAISLLDPKIADAEALAIKKQFTKKRDLMCERLNTIGIIIKTPPEGTFYCWGNVSELNPKLNTGTLLFQEGLKVGVITVPGVFFDINPGKRRPDRYSRFGNYARFSFGSPLEEIERGLDKLETLIKKM